MKKCSKKLEDRKELIIENDIFETLVSELVILLEAKKRRIEKLKNKICELDNKLRWKHEFSNFQ